MLGSAIPKRWVVSLALVGLVSLLMFSDAALSSERASAQDGVGVTLTSVTSPTTVSFPAGTVVGVTTEVKDENGLANATLANDNYSWAVTGGCGTATAFTTVPQTSFTAGSAACSGTITVDAYQDTATTSTVRDVDTITAAGTGAGDRTSAVGVASAAVTTTAIDMAGTTAVSATALTVDSAVGIAALEYVKVGSELMKVSARADAVTTTVPTNVGSLTAIDKPAGDAYAVDATALTVDSVVGIAATNYVKVGTEIMKVSAAAGAVTTTVPSSAVTTTAINMGGTTAANATAITVDSKGTIIVGEYIKVGNELMKVTALPGGEVLTVTRGVHGTTAATFVDNAVVIEVTVGTAINDGSHMLVNATLVTVDASASFSDGDYALIGSEIIQITTVDDGTNDGTTLGPLVRGMFGTSAAQHNDNVEIIEITVVKPLLTVTRGVHGTTAATFVDNAALTEVTVGNAINDAGNIAAGVTDITVDSSANFAAGGYAKIGTEIIQITTVENGTSLNPVVRGMFGTTAATAADNAEVNEVTVVGTLAAADTILLVADGSVFAANDYVEIGTEVLKISLVTANVLTVSRGEFGTTDASHAVDATITKQITKSGSTAVSVTVAAAVAATPVPTDPSPVPSIVPDGLTADDVAVILPSSGGSFTEVGGTASITVPSSAVTSGTAAAVNIVSVSSSDVPAPPAPAAEGVSGTFNFGSSIIKIQWYDDTGSELATFDLNRPAEICVPFNTDDIAGAAGGPEGMSVWRYNGTEWIELNSTVNISAGTVCANTLSFSFFALGLSVADAEDVVVLPSTGGYAPSTWTMVLAMLAGIALVATGAFTARRARRVRETS